MILLLSKIEKTTSRRGFGTGLLSRLEHGKLNIPIRHPSGDVAQAIEFSSLEFRTVRKKMLVSHPICGILF